jgi:hypothetical protein
MNFFCFVASYTLLHRTPSCHPDRRPETVAATEADLFAIKMLRDALGLPIPPGTCRILRDRANRGTPPGHPGEVPGDQVL